MSPATLRRHASQGRAFLQRTAVLGLFFFVAFVALNAKPAAAVGTQTSDGMFVYGETAATAQRYRAYTDSAADASKFGSEGSTSQGAASVNWNRVEFDPTGGGDALSAFQVGTTLYVDYWNAKAWSTSTSFTSLTTGGVGRNWDIAFESQSGDAIVVYETGGTIKWQRWVNSTQTWASLPAAVYSTEPGDAVQWMVLAPDPTADTMILVWSDALADLHSIVYNGTSWEEANTEEVLETNIATTSRNFDVAWEHTSGHALIAYGQSGTAVGRYRTHDGTTTSPWGAEQNMAAGFGVVSEFIDLEANPSNDKIAAVWWMSGGQDDLAGGIWSGTGWASQDDIDTTLTDYSADIGDDRPAMVSWANASSSTAVIVYYDSAPEVNTLDYCSATAGNSWTCTTATLTGLTASHSRFTWVGDMNANRLVVAYVNNINDIKSFYTTDGSTWTCINSCNALEADATDKTALDIAMNRASGYVAQAGIWDGGGADANVSTAGNWETDAVPGASDNIVFESGTKAATWNSSGPATVASITLQSGYANTVTVSRTLTVTGELDIASGAGFTFSGQSLTLGQLTNSGTLTDNASSTLTFNSTSGDTLPALTLSGNLVFSAASGTYNLDLSADSSIGGDLTVSSGTVSYNGVDSTPNTLTVSGGDVSVSGTLNLYYHALALSGTGNISGTGTFKVRTLTVDGTTTITNSGTKELYRSLVVNGTISLNGKDLKIGSSSLGPDLSGAGTIYCGSGNNTCSAGTVTFVGNGTTPTVNGAGSYTFYNVQLGKSGSGGNSSFDVTGSFTVLNTLTITGTGASCACGNADIDLGSSTITLAGSGTPLAFAETGTLTYTYGTSTFVYTNATSATITNTYNFYNLTTNGAGTYTLPAGTITLDNTLTLSQGTLTAATNNPTINIAGNISIASGATYTKGSGTTTLSGTSKTITDSNSTTQDLGAVSISGTYSLSSSAKLTSLAGAGTLTLNANTLTVTGNGTPISITSYSASTNSTTIYSHATSATIAAKAYYHLTLSGGGTYTFAAGTHTIGGDLTLSSGTLTAATNNPTINISGNVSFSSGTTYTKGSGTTTLRPTGTKTVTDSTAAGQDLGVVSISLGLSTPQINLGSSVKATSITIAASHTLNANGSNTLTLTGTSGTVFTISGAFTESTSTVVYSGANAGGNTTVAADTYYNLQVTGADTYTLAGDTPVSNVLTVGASATLDASSRTVTLSGTTGTPFSLSGALTEGTSTFVYSGNNAGGTTNVAADTYYNLQVTGADTYTLAGDTPVSNVLTVGASATLDANSRTVTLSGTTGTPFSLSGALTEGTSTFVYSGNNAGGTTNVAADTYYNLQVTGAETYDLAGDTTVSTVLTVGLSATLDGKTRTLTLSGTTGIPFSLSGAFTESTSTVVYSGNNTGGNTTVVSDTYYNLTLNNSSETFSPGGTLTVSNGLTVSGGTLAMSTTALNVGSTSIANSGSIKVAASQALTQTASGTTTMTGSLSGSNCIGSSGASCAGTAGTITFGNLTVGDGSTDSTTTIGGTTTVTVGGDLTIAALHTLDAGSATIALTGTDGSPFANSGTFTASTSTVAYEGANGAGDTSITAVTYNNLNLGGSATTETYLAAGDLTVGGTLTIVSSSGTNTFDASSRTITLSGSGTPFVISASEVFTPSTSTVVYSGSSATNVAAATYNNLNLGGSGTTVTYTAAGDLTVGGTLTIVSSSGTNTFDASSRTITLSGSGTPFVISASEVFTPTSSTITYTNGTSATITSTTYNHLTLNGAGTFTFDTGTVNIDGDLSLSLGTLTAATNNPTLNLAGNLTLASGTTFTKGTGTVTLKPTGTKTWTDSTASGQDLGTVSIASGSSTPKINLGSSVKATTVAIALAHTLDVNGANTLTLTGSGTPITVTGTLTPSTGTIAFANGTSATIPSSINYYGLTTSGAGTYTAATGTLTVDGNLAVSAGTLNLDTNDPATTVAGNVTIDGTLVASSAATLVVRGDWTNNATFTHSNGTVRLASPSAADSTSNVAGSAGTNFYSLTIIDPGKTVRFAATRTFGVAGTLTATGGPFNQVRLYSSTSGPGTADDRWLINLSGNVDFTRVGVQNAGCGVGTATVSGSDMNNHGNNDSACWNFRLFGGGGGSARTESSGGGSQTTGGGIIGGGNVGGGGGGNQTTGGNSQGGGGGGRSE